MEKILKYQKELFWILAFLIIGIFVATIYQGRSQIFRRFDYKVWEDKYNNSQWVVPNSKNEISDEDLFIYEGYRLVKGYDPSLLSAEVPPLGKYLIGFSEIIFGNIGIYGIFFSALSLILLFCLNKIIFGSNVLAIIPVVFLAIDPLFREQIGLSLLDTQYLSLLLLTFILTLKKKYIWAGIAAGLFMATKSPFITGVLYISIFVYLFYRKSFNIKNYLLMLAASAITYTLAYIKLFLLGHSFRYFLSVQHYMTNFYQTGAGGVIGAVFPMLLSGYWFTWFNKNGFINDWNPFWPVVFILSLLAIYKLIKTIKTERGVLLISIWTCLYMVFLIFVPIFSRYLLLAVPFMYNLSVWVLLKTIKSSRLYLS